MAVTHQARINAFMDWVHARNPGEHEFCQAVEEVMMTVIPFVEENPQYNRDQLLERMTEPDRVISFRVCWEDDKGNLQVNRGYRVQFNNSIGPYKGGIRFHPSVSQSILKFLGFEQTFKNSLTTLPLGGGKGGADFDPKGKSDREVMRFCQGFMTELFRHIGSRRDVPAGDIGVGAREVSYMFGQYKRLDGQFTGVLTGKGLAYGGSLIRTEATGYGCVYLAREALHHIDEDIAGKVYAISGSGNVAQYAAEKVLQLGGKVVTMSDSGGFIHDPDGIDAEKLAYIMELKNVRRGRISEYAQKFKAHYHEGKRPWHIKCDVALPCATQNEISRDDAQALVDNGTRMVAEGANMPTDAEGVKVFQDAKIIYLPGKAANAGGVAVSGLEMTQNSIRLSWTRQEMEERLQHIMRDIHTQCLKYGQEPNHVNYMKGANLAGFVKVADAMLSFGCV